MIIHNSPPGKGFLTRGFIQKLKLSLKFMDGRFKGLQHASIFRFCCGRKCLPGFRVSVVRHGIFWLRQLLLGGVALHVVQLHMQPVHVVPLYTVHKGNKISYQPEDYLQTAMIFLAIVVTTFAGIGVGARAYVTGVGATFAWFTCACLIFLLTHGGCPCLGEICCSFMSLGWLCKILLRLLRF